MDEPQLKYKDARVIDCHDLDKFVNMHLEGYGKTWRSLDTDYDGYHNGSFVDTTVQLGVMAEDDDDQDFGRWITGEGPFYLDPEDTYSYDLPGVQNILQWLCNKGVISEGYYVVKMWW